MSRPDNQVDPQRWRATEGAPTLRSVSGWFFRILLLAGIAGMFYLIHAKGSHWSHAIQVVPLLLFLLLFLSFRGNEPTGLWLLGGCAFFIFPIVAFEQGKIPLLNYQSSPPEIFLERNPALFQKLVVVYFALGSLALAVALYRYFRLWRRSKVAP